MQLADARVSERPLFSERDRWFESASLQRGVIQKPIIPTDLAGQAVGLEPGGDVTPFSDNPDIRKRFGIKEDMARQTTVSF